MLQKEKKIKEIIQNFKTKQWIYQCIKNDISAWDLIEYIKSPVFVNNYLIEGFQVTATRCHNCYTDFSLHYNKGNFIVKKRCKCGDDGLYHATIDKLSCYFTPEDSQKLLDLSNMNRRKGLSNTIEFWISKGLDVAAAKIKVSEVQKSRSSRSPAAKIGARGFSRRTKEYWINRGCSELDAIKEVKHEQTKNGLEYYNNKYGRELGPIFFNERMERWLNSLGNRKMTEGRSKVSIELFNKINLNGYFGENEKVVRGKNRSYRVDFLLDKKIIEFNGDYWHANPLIFTEDCLIRKKVVKDIWKNDHRKIIGLSEVGYNVLVIWESEYRLNPDQTIKKCRNFLNES